MRREELLELASSMVRPYRISPPRLPAGGRSGVFAGQGDGQSVDFHDFREYQPGDDLRRVDWRAYARNGQMHLRLFREEVSPVVELHLDTSASMAAYPGKEQTAVFLAAFLRLATLAAEGRPVLCRDGLRFAGGDFEKGLLSAAFGGAAEDRPPRARGGARPLRFCLFDYLLADGLATFLERQAAGSLHFYPIMILSRSEANPPWRGFHRLAETENPAQTIDLALDDRTVGDYLTRLRRHEDMLAGLARRQGARLLRMDVPDGDVRQGDLEAVVRHLSGERVVTAR